MGRGSADEGDFAARVRRRYAHLRDVALTRGARDTHEIALDDDTTDEPVATSSADHASAIHAVDGDPETAWRGAPGDASWTWTMPFRRIVHLGMLRAHFGDGSARGVPGAWRWEVKPPVDGICQSWGLWVELPGGKHDDRDGNTFLYGPMEAHAQKQVLFADADACAVRMVITESDGGPPVVREVKLLESAPSLTRRPGTVVEAHADRPAVSPSSAGGAVDGSYEGAWTGDAGADSWSLSVHLASAEIVDRLRLTLGQDAVTVARDEGAPGRSFSGAYLPLGYRVETSFDDDPAHLVTLPEADPPLRDGSPLPVRRRLVHFPPRPVKLLRLTIGPS
jgi:hypothetical protein